MSSFYDETARIIHWVRKNQLEPSVLSEILERRLKQAEEHWTWCAKRNAVARRILAEELNNRGKSPWVLPNMKAAGINTTGDFFEVFRQLMKLLSSFSADELYGSLTESLVREVFDALHDAGHHLGQMTQAHYSDNPYPMGRRVVSDSNVWLREQFPDRPWQK